MRTIKLEVFCAFLSFISLASSQGILPNFLDAKFEIENQHQPRLLQGKNQLPECRSNGKCFIVDVKYQSSTLELPPDSQLVLRAFFYDEDMERDVVIQYSSSIQHPNISTKIFVRPENNLTYKEYDLPQGSSWTRVIPKYEFMPYMVLVLYFDNDTPYITTISLKINIPWLPPFPPSSYVEYYSRIPLILAGVAIFAVLLLGFLCCFYLRGSNRRHANRIYNMQGPAQHGVLAEPLPVQNFTLLFPEKNFANLMSSFSQSKCTICLEELVSEQSCRQLYCEHIFHSECLTLWLVNQLTKGRAFCPNCKTDVMQKSK